MYQNIPHYDTDYNIQSDQKVSVHLMITIQKTGSQRFLITLYISMIGKVL